MPPVQETRAFVVARGWAVAYHGRMNERRNWTSQHYPHPPFKWLAWMIAGAAGFAAIGGLTWSDAPGILAKVMLVLALSMAVAAVLILLIRLRGKYCGKRTVD
jgi:hypothetical protein